MSLPRTLGVDIGASLIKAAIVTHEGELTNLLVIPTNREAALEQLTGVLQYLVDCARTLRQKIGGIGIGVPGVVDIDKGRVLYALNLKWRNLDLASYLNAVTGLPVRLDTDRNVGLLGELTFGNIADSRNVVAVSWGSGVACALYIKGEVYRGAHGIVAEFGHITIDWAGKLCVCGQRGCLGAYCGALALRDVLSPMLTRDCVNTVAEHEIIQTASRLARTEPSYRNVFLDAAMKLGIGIANICNIIDPERVVIWGGLSNLDDYVFDFVGDNIREHVHETYRNHVIVEQAKFRQYSGLLGTTTLFTY